MDFKDYYAIMGVSRDATQDEIKRSYRKLARKYHPDVSDDPQAENRFKEVGEAYEVLKDPEKRVAYDQLGSQWQSGQDFRPPPDWDQGFEHRGAGHSQAEAEQFSDFFESLFGARGHGGGRSHRQFHARGEDHHARVSVDLEDSYSGAQRTITLRAPELSEDGHVVLRERTLNVRIPKGIRSGKKSGRKDRALLAWAMANPAIFIYRSSSTHTVCTGSMSVTCIWICRSRPGRRLLARR